MEEVRLGAKSSFNPLRIALRRRSTTDKAPSHGSRGSKMEKRFMNHMSELAVLSERDRIDLTRCFA